MNDNPLPQWTPVDDFTYEATAPNGVVWRLWTVEEQGHTPEGWLLAPRDEPSDASFIKNEHGLYAALDTAGLRIVASSR